MDGMFIMDEPFVCEDNVVTGFEHSAVEAGMLREGLG